MIDSLTKQGGTDEFSVPVYIVFHEEIFKFIQEMVFELPDVFDLLN